MMQRDETVSSASGPSASTLAPSEDVSEKDLTIIVKQMNSDTYRVSLLETATVRELKQKIASLSDVTVDRQRLIYQGKVLIDAASTLKDYGVKDEHTIHLVARPTEADPERQAENDQPTSPRPRNRPSAAAATTTTTPSSSAAQPNGNGPPSNGSRAEMVVTFGAMEIPPHLASNLQQMMQRQQQGRRQQQQTSSATSSATNAATSGSASNASNGASLDPMALLQSVLAARDASNSASTARPAAAAASASAPNHDGETADMRPASHLQRVETHLRNVNRFLRMQLPQRTNTLPIEEIRLPTTDAIRAMRAEMPDVQRAARLMRDIVYAQEQLGTRMLQLAYRYEAGMVDVGQPGAEEAVMHDGAVVSNALYRLAQINMLLFPVLASTAIATHPTAAQRQQEQQQQQTSEGSVRSQERSIWFHAPFMPSPVSISSGTPQATAPSATSTTSTTPATTSTSSSSASTTAATVSNHPSQRAPQRNTASRVPAAFSFTPPTSTPANATSSRTAAAAVAAGTSSAPSASSAPATPIDIPPHLYANTPLADPHAMLERARSSFKSILGLHPLAQSASQQGERANPKFSEMITPKQGRSKNQAEGFLMALADHFKMDDICQMLDGDFSSLATLPAYLLPHFRAKTGQFASFQESDMNALAIEIAGGLMKIQCEEVDLQLQPLMTTRIELLQAMENTLIYALKRLIWQIVLSGGERPGRDPAFPRFVQHWFAELIEDWTRAVQEAADDETRPLAAAFQHYIMRNILHNLFSTAWDVLTANNKATFFQQLADGILAPSTSALAASMAEQRQREASSSSALNGQPPHRAGMSRIRPTPPSPARDEDSMVTDHHARSPTASDAHDHRDNSKRRRLHSTEAEQPTSSSSPSRAGAPTTTASAPRRARNEPDQYGAVTLDDSDFDDSDPYKVTVSIEVEEQVMPDVD